MEEADFHFPVDLEYRTRPRTALGTLFRGTLGRDLGLAVALGVLYALSFPPIGLWPLSLASVAFFLLLVRERTGPAACGLALVYGMVSGAGCLYWLFGLFGAFAGLLIWLYALYWGLLGWLIGWTRGQAPVARAALVATFAVAIEWLRGDAWYLCFPWYTVPHALAQAPDWIAASRWLGTYGLSFLIWFLAAWGAFGNRWLWAALLLLPAAALLLPHFDPPDRRVLLVQAERTDAIERVIAEAPAGKVDLAVLPEYAYHAAPSTIIRSPTGPASLARKVDAPVIFGAVTPDWRSVDIEVSGKGDDYYNVAALIDADGRLIGLFPKQRPVPLLRDGLPGEERPVFPLDQSVLGIGICFDFDGPEIAGGLVRQGATLLVDPSFDAMSWGRAQHLHHELLRRLRAVENDRWILRAASSGRSEVVDPHGRPSTECVEIGETGFVVAAYGHRESMPPGSHLAILGPGAALGAALFLLCRLGLKRRHAYA